MRVGEPRTMMEYRLTNEADEDVVESYLYGLRNFGGIQAERYATSLDRCFDLIATFPEMARERPEFNPPVRIHHHERHYIIYRIELDHVLIIRVLRGEMDLASHLNE